MNIILENEEIIDISASLKNDFLKGEKGDIGPKGEKGDKGDIGNTGPSNILTIGTIEKGDEASATITGESPNQRLNLVLPKGDKGEKGNTGEQGIQGIQGDKGEKGDTGEKGEKGDKGDKGDIGDVSKEQLKESEKKIYSQFGIDIAKGKNITINNSSNLSYNKFHIGGNSIQDGTPTSEAPVEIQSVDTVEIKQIGKNLLNIEEFINNLKNTFSVEEIIYDNKNCYQISTSKNTHYYNLSNIEENMQYTIQLNLANTLSDFYLMFVYTDGTKQAISQQQSINNLTKIVATSDVNKTLKQIQISLYSTNKLYIEKDTLLLEKGVGATEYEPYKEKFYAISLSTPLRSLPNGVCDTIEEDGIHRRVRRYVFTGDEGVQQYAGGTYSFVIFVNGTYKYNADINNVLSNTLQNKTLNELYRMRDTINQNLIAQSNGCFAVMINNFTTAEEIKTYLAEQYANGTPVIVDYELAEEVIAPLTEEQKVIYDNLINNGTFKGITNLSSASRIKPELDIEYYKDLEDTLNNLQNVLKDILDAIQNGGTTSNTIAEIEQIIVSYFENKTVEEVEA